MKEVFIVESVTDENELRPCLNRFLDKNSFEILVCKGHIREIREGNTYRKIKDYGIDLESFVPEYVIKDDSVSLIGSLKKKTEKADMVYLVTDQDREGEAIAWHLKEVLSLKKGRYKRMPCYEYTFKTVKAAYDNAGEINMNLVESQVGRAVLDKLVGYDISPLIQKKFYRHSLSGGRIQSVALKIVCDREKEIMNFVPEEYYDISGDFSKKENKTVFSAKLVGFDEKKIGERDIKSPEYFQSIMDDLKGASYTVKDIKKEEKTAAKVRPFKATTMQKAAPWDPDKTMSLAQKLKGKNLITYHRTDSTRVPEDKLAEAKVFIENNFGKEYTSFYVQPGKEKGVQDGHVAIMPTDIEKTPSCDFIKNLPADEKKLYILIWNQFIAAMMAPEKYILTTAIIGANRCDFRASGTSPVFDGASRILKNDRKADLPVLTVGEEVDLRELKSEKKQTNPPARYDERSLAAKLDEEKIGRPSTISTYPKTLKQRKYVVKDPEDKKLHPTELGMDVCDGLSEYIKSIMNIKFTSQLEEQLDDIADGNQTKKTMLDHFYPKFCQEIQLASSEMEKPEILEEECPKCHSRLQIKNGKYGKFKCCTNYPECDYVEDSRPESVLLDRLCPECGHPLRERVGRYGKFVGCSDYPKCRYVEKDASEKKSFGVCPKCKKGHIESKMSRKGTFYGCSDYPKCDFATWYAPTDKICEVCGYPMGIHKTKTIDELKCTNRDCETNRRKK